MGRLLFHALFVVVGVWLVRRALARADGGDPPAPPRPTEELVRCAHCAILLPRAEARLAGGAIYCSEAHARLGPRKG